MSTVTPNLGLFKYNTSTDANSAFNINKALNNNWDIIDNALTNVDALPDQTGKAGYLLTTDGTNASWGETSEIPCVVETYQNGTSWYRIWSDGWCEQGVYKSWGDGGSYTFLKPYKDTNWILVSNGDGGDATSNMGVTSRAATGFSYNNSNQSHVGSVYVCGYISGD